MPANRRKYIRIFVSSTFSDMDRERNYVRETIEALKIEYQKAGWTVDYIDLRWGISPNTSADNRTMTICLNELQQCRNLSPKPNFILLLGERYGWRPLPEGLYPMQMVTIWHNATEEECRLLDRWYYLDKNDTRDSYGIFRLASRSGTGLDATAFSSEVESQLLPLIRKYLPELDHSATEMEACQGIFGDEDTADGHVFAYTRTFGQIPTDIRPRYIDEGLDGEYQSRFRRKVKETLEEQYIYEENDLSWNDYGTPEFEKRFKDRLRTYLSSVIDKEIEAGKALTEIDYENFVHMDFARSESESFYGRSADIDSICRYIESGNEARPLWMRGASGLGKSTLMAKIATMYADRPDFTVIPVFCSQSKISSDSRQIMRYIREALEHITTKQLGQNDNIHIYADKLPRENNYLIIIDAIDQLDGRTYPDFASLSWITDRNRLLPPNVRVIISSTDDARFPLDTALTEHLRLGSMKDDAEKMLLHRLACQNRCLTEAQLEAVRRYLPQADCSGLYLTVISAILAEIDSRATINSIPISAEWGCIFILNSIINSGLYGERLTCLVLALVAASSDGIDSANLSRLLALDPEVRAELSASSFHQWNESDTIPPIVLSRLLYLLNKSVFRISTSPIGLTIKFRHNAIRRELTQKWIRVSDIKDARELMLKLYAKEYLSGNLLALRDYIHTLSESGTAGIADEDCFQIRARIDSNSADGLEIGLRTDDSLRTAETIRDILYNPTYISIKEKYFPGQIITELDSYIRICDFAKLEKERADALIAKNFIVYTIVDQQAKANSNRKVEALSESEWLMLIYNTWDSHPLRITSEKRFDSTMLPDLYRNIDPELLTVYSIDDCSDKPWLAPNGEVLYRLRVGNDGKHHLEKVNLRTGDVERLVLREPDIFIDYKVSDDLTKIFIASADGIDLYDTNMRSTARNRLNPDGFIAHIDMKGIEWLDISPDGMYLAAGGSDSDTFYYNISTKRTMKWGKCRQAKLSPSGKVLWAYQWHTTADDKQEITVSRVDFETCKVNGFTYTNKNKNAYDNFCIECSDDLAVFCNLADNVYIYDGEIRAWSFHKQAPIQYARILPRDNKILVFYAYSGAYAELQINGSTLSIVKQGNSHVINQLTPDFKYGLTIHDRKVFDFEALRKTFALSNSGNVAGLNSASASADGKTTVLSTGVNISWEAGEIRRPIITEPDDAGHYTEHFLDVDDSQYCHYVSASAVSPDGRKLVYATFAPNKFIVFFYDLANRRLTASAPIRRQALKIMFTGDSRWVTVITGDPIVDVEAYIHIFDLNGRQTGEIECNDYLTLTAKSKIMMSPDNRYFAYWANDIVVWDLVEKKIANKYTVDYKRCSRHALIFDPKSSELIFDIGGNLVLAAISQSGRYHYLAGEKGSLYVRDTSTGYTGKIRERVSKIVPTLDDRHFYVATEDDRIELYDNDGRLLQQTLFHNQRRPLQLMNTARGLMVGRIDCHAALLQPDQALGVDTLPVTTARRRWNLSTGKLEPYEAVCPLCGATFAPSKKCPSCGTPIQIEHTEKSLFRRLFFRN